MVYNELEAGVMQRNTTRESLGSQLSEADISEFSEDENEQDHAEMPHMQLDADTFGMTICSIARDSHFVSVHGTSLKRAFRLGNSVFLVLFTILVQVVLLAKVKEFVVAKAVYDIRHTYDKFEVAIYGEENCTVTAHGCHRGILAQQPAMDVMQARFDALDAADKGHICHIPLSQPFFFGLVLAIWTLTCGRELRRAFGLQESILKLPTVQTMAVGMKNDHDEFEAKRGKIILGLTPWLKVLITLTTFVPRVAVSIYTLWVGCRWLLATNHFGKLVLNAVALEFILCLSELIFSALVPHRNQFDVENTKIIPFATKLHASWWTFTRTVWLLLMSLAWVVMYIGTAHTTGWQDVVPQYNWDVHTVCEKFMQERYGYAA